MSKNLLILTGIKKILHIPEKVPKFVQIAVTNLCNKNCGMCIRSKIDIEEVHMDFGDFKRIIERINGAEVVTLVGLGEPLIYPYLTEAIRYCKENGLKNRITTNGILLGDKARELIEAGLDTIHISLENLRDKKLLENILKLKQLRIEKGLRHPKIVLQPVLFDDKERGRTVKDVYDIIAWAGQNGLDKVNIARVDLRTDPTMKRPNLIQERQIFKQLAKLRRKYGIRIDCLQDQVFKGPRGFLYKHFKWLLRLDSYCFRLQDFIYINVNGDVYPCCLSEEQIMGNLLNQDLWAIWHGERFNYLRKHQEEFNFCKKCDFLRLKQLA